MNVWNLKVLTKMGGVGGGNICLVYTKCIKTGGGRGCAASWLNIINQVGLTYIVLTKEHNGYLSFH